MSAPSMPVPEKRHSNKDADEFASSASVDAPRLTVTDMTSIGVPPISLRPSKSLAAYSKPDSNGSAKQGQYHSLPQAQPQPSRLVGSRSFPSPASAGASVASVGPTLPVSRMPGSPNAPGSPRARSSPGLDEAHFRVRAQFHPHHSNGVAVGPETPADETIYEEFITPRTHRSDSNLSSSSTPPSPDNELNVVRLLRQQVDECWADAFAKSTRIAQQLAVIDEQAAENARLRSEIENYREQEAVREAELTTVRAELVGVRARLVTLTDQYDPAGDLERLRSANASLAAELEAARTQAEQVKDGQTGMLEELTAKTKQLEDELAKTQNSTGTFARRLNGLLNRVAFRDASQPPVSHGSGSRSELTSSAPMRLPSDDVYAEQPSFDEPGQGQGQGQQSQSQSLVNSPQSSFIISSPQPQSIVSSPQSSFLSISDGRSSPDLTDAPLGNVAICFTDIEGSTEKWESNPEWMQKALTLHNELIRRLIRETRGYEVKTEGDSFMIAWPDAVQAVSFCVRLELGLMEVEWPEPMMSIWPDLREVRGPRGELLWRGLRVRTGVHYGCPSPHVDPLTGRMDYLGIVVNRASRISHMAAPGQILVSSEVAALVRQQIPGVELKSMGNFSFKGVAEELAVFCCTPLQLLERVFLPNPHSQQQAPATIDKSIAELAHQNEQLRSALEALEKELHTVLVKTEAVQKQINSGSKSTAGRGKVAFSEQLRTLQKKVSVFRDESVRVREHLLEVIQQKRALIAERDALLQRLTGFDGSASAPATVAAATTKTNGDKRPEPILTRDKSPLPGVGQAPRIIMFGHQRSPSAETQAQAAVATGDQPAAASSAAAAEKEQQQHLSPRQLERASVSHKEQAGNPRAKHVADSTRVSPREFDQRPREYDGTLTRHPSLDFGEKRERPTTERAVAPPRRQATQPTHINILPLQLERKTSFNGRPDSLPPTGLPPARSRDPSPNAARRRSIVDAHATSIKVTKL
eukprot:TRINITY_DN8575_c0_g1_i3.p1 TRINITY_DN8575_c0_g1~~TRINITY_DN8575_c0_g1_i3.p1  ORF type:complete len:981 (-),score=350.39 TRINITY_DN8575_c0_g1_i3:220-3162(-)